MNKTEEKDTFLNTKGSRHAMSFIQELTEETPQGITLLYGPAASGKSTACLQAIEGKTAYISSRHNFSAERLSSLRTDSTQVLDRIALFKPTNLNELERAVEQALSLAQSLNAIIIDSLGTFLREADRKAANLALDRITRKLDKAPCAVIIVTDAMDRPERERELGFVGGDILRFYARTIIELHEGRASIKKHPALTGREWKYKITTEGLVKEE